MPKVGKRPMTGTNRTGLNWYSCDHCGEIFLRKRNVRSPRSFCKPECDSKWKSGYQKGRRFSEDHKRKIGESRIGKPRSKETREKLSRAKKELYKNPEFKERMRRETWDNPVWRGKVSEGKKGSNNPNWKGGPSKRKRVPTPADEYRESWEWRCKSEEIRERDNHACSNCGKKFEKGDGQLDVHHTYPLNDWIDRGFDPSDYPDSWLMALDKSCHTKAETQPGIFKLPPNEE